jgi:cytochrome oxidase assembly protein ShyY1
MLGRMFRFLLKPRWIALGLFAVVVTGLCVRFGIWQLDRLHGRRYVNQQFTEGMAASPQNLETLVDASGGAPLRYRQAWAQGIYDPAREVILYGRTNAGEPGNHVLTPLRLPDGRAVLVDRGWVPFTMDTPPVPEGAPPTTRVKVVGLLVPSEPGGAPEQAGATTFTRVDLDRIGAGLPYPLLPYAIQLRTQDPAQTGALPVPPPAPTLDEGPHMDYALQWFAFAAIAGFGFLLLVVREARHPQVSQRATADVHGPDA